MMRESEALKLATTCEFRHAVDDVNRGDPHAALRHILRAASYLGAVPAVAHYKEGVQLDTLDPIAQEEWDNLGVVCGQFIAAFCTPIGTPSNGVN